MFCDKPIVNQLTALLLAHGITDVVACPGSRNAALVHDFAECERRGTMRLFSVVDERSAAFVGIGVALAVRKPVAVCVTSGSALLNTLPAVAEAYYRRLPLLIISADRPAKWIGQLDGQTLPQQGALLPYTQTFQLSESELDWNHRMINEALGKLSQPSPQPVHLNVPLSEPLFSFTTPELPAVQRIESCHPASSHPFSPAQIEQIAKANCPLLYIGQYEKGKIAAVEALQENHQMVVLPEIIAGQTGSRLLHLFESGRVDVRPDVVVHVGGNGVGKRLKQQLRRDGVPVIRIEDGDAFPDTFSHLSTIVYAQPEAALRQLSERLPAKEAVREWQENARQRLTSAAKSCEEVGMMAELELNLRGRDAVLHLANSQTIRKAAEVFDAGDYEIYANRGVNGIEGSLSVAAGFALATRRLNVMLIGDLSFFYDHNALWNKQLGGNLRIVLFNNGGGRIFDNLPGLSASHAHLPYVSANHTTEAAGICQAYQVDYVAVRSAEEFCKALPSFLAEGGVRPQLIEIFTESFKK